MARRLAPILVVLAAALASVLGLVPRPATGTPQHTVDYVVIAGIAGLRWDDVNPTDTPTLWLLAKQGSVGALSVRSAHQPTCPADGWLTLGAGNYAQRTIRASEVGCPPLAVRLDRPDANGAYLPDQQSVVRVNQDLPWGAQPGALAETMRCTAAVGPGAAVAAARSYGRVDRYSPTLPDDADRLLASCVLSFVDLGTVSGYGVARQVAARLADAQLARVVADRPARSLLLVAGLADTDATSRLHVAIAHGRGYEGGWLTSPSTSRPGYLQLTDLAPTALAALGRPVPPKLFSGGAAIRIADRPADPTLAVDRLSDADHEAWAQRRVAARFFAALTFCQLMLFVAVAPLLRRARRPAGPHTPPPVPAPIVGAVEVLLVAAALAVPAAFVADVVPWWRYGLPGLVFTAVMLLALAAGTLAVTRTRLGRRTLGPLGGVAGVAAAVVGLDVLTGARLQLNGVAGYSALTGGRYSGLGPVGLGVFVTGVLLVASCLALQVRRPWRPVVVAVAGAIGVIMVGSPYLGADAAGAVALAAGACVCAAMSTGGWLTFARLAWAVLAGIGVTSGFALLDVSLPVEQRGSLGRFVGHVRDGTSSLVLHRVGADNVITMATSPLTLLVLGSALFVFFALLRPWGGLKRLFGLYPPVRGALAGVFVASVMAGLAGGVGFTVAGAAVATALPLAALAALRVLDHADERSQPPAPAEPPPFRPAVTAETVPVPAPAPDRAPQPAPGLDAPAPA